MKPTMFIGSSTEGLPVAKAIQSNLEHSVEVTLWSQGIFGLSKNTLEDLVKSGAQYDFAAFVLSPDDELQMRGQDLIAARDNVIFELGLFIGSLGKGRVFFVTPKIEGFHLPTDLHGITPAIYNPKSHHDNLQGQLGCACNQIEKSISSIMSPNSEFANLAGEWKGYWEVDSPNFPSKNRFDTEIKQIGEIIISSFKTKGMTYPIVGEIHRGGLITGIWGSPENGASYYGPFQLVVSPCGKTLDGKWSGFKKDLSVDSGKFCWKRKKS